MRRFDTLFLCLTLVLLAAGSNASAQTQLTTRDVITGLYVPWEIIWGPDNWIWMTERSGRISRVNPETGEQNLLIAIPDVAEQTESGLLGMVLHPNFIDTPHVFVVYNYRVSGNIREKLVRYTYDGTTLVNPTILLENITGNFAHDGSRLLILPDRTLVMTTGDALNQSSAQSWTSLNGKVLRMNLDGTAPADNPMSGAGFPSNLIWSSGHRNPQGMTLAPNGTIYTSMHGANSDDEINLIMKGRNYGWPTVQGFCNTPTEQTFCQDSNVVEPLKAWSPTIAPAGIEYYNSPAIPEWRGSLLLTTLNAAGSDLRVLELSSDGQQITGETIYYDGTYGRLRDLCVAPDGRVFISTSNRDGRGNPRTGDDRIIEIKATVVSVATITTGEVGVGHTGAFHGGEPITVPFTIDGTFNAGNVFTAQISDAGGSFANPTTIGTLAGTSAGTIQGALPCGLPNGIGYRVRVVSNTPSVIGSNNGTDIAVAPPPMPRLGQDLAICEGDSANVGAAAGYASYRWSTGETTRTITIHGAGVYAVTVTDEFGCTGLDTMIVTVSPKPAATITKNGNMLMANSAAAYQWSLDGTPIPGATSQSHTATQSGTYTVAVVNDAGCRGISQPLAVILSSVPLVEGSSGDLKLHPQPAKDHIAIEVGFEKEAWVRLRVTDMNGVALMTIDDGRASGSYRRELRIDALPAGVYFIEIESGSHIRREKFVKE